VDAASYVRVVKKMVEAIRMEDPDRLIISDGLGGGVHPVPELAGLGLAQSTRGYAPHALTHFEAPWSKTNAEGETSPEPRWPLPAVNAVLSGNDSGLEGPLVLLGGFLRGGLLTCVVKMSGGQARLKVLADGVLLVSKAYPELPDQDWKVLPLEQRRELRASVPAGCKEITLAVEGGNLVLSQVKVWPAGGSESELPLSGEEWDLPQQPVLLREDGHLDLDRTPWYSRDWMWERFMAPWRDLQGRGVGVHVGEFACYNRTPHAVALAWMEDWLANWKKAGWGWALWNFRGSMGILDSGRTDVQYADFHGHKLDEKMLQLLQRY
jgi:hypothetical protein